MDGCPDVRDGGRGSNADDFLQGHRDVADWPLPPIAAWCGAFGTMTQDLVRLSEASLGTAATGVLRPDYDRARVTAGIVHLGIGAFHRAHQAVYTDAVLAAG